MNREQIIQMAREVGIRFRRDVFHSGYCDGVHGDELEAFAKLVAKHTLANIDPSSFMSWQEGYEAGKQTEREACAKVCEDIYAWNMDDPASTAVTAIRAREDQA
jgi:hypothetical protein